MTETKANSFKKRLQSVVFDRAYRGPLHGAAGRCVQQEFRFELEFECSTEEWFT